MISHAKKITAVLLILSGIQICAASSDFQNVIVHKNLKVNRRARLKDAHIEDDLIVDKNFKVKKNTVLNDLTVNGTLRLQNGSVSQTDSIITGNISLGNSTVTTGNITKNGILFASNFGLNNTFVGQTAGNLTLTGSNNSGFGANSLQNNMLGSGNTAHGSNSLTCNQNGNKNSAFGTSALTSNTTGSENVAVGSLALLDNTVGNFNTANGSGSLLNNTVGNNNTAYGYQALFNNAVGSFNIALGASAGSLVETGNQNIHIGHPGLASDNGVTRIGITESQNKTFIAGVRGVTTGMSNGVAVFVDSNDQLGTIASSVRFKENVERISKVSELLLKLRPVTFNYSADDNKDIQYGFIAEEVAQVLPELVVFDDNNMPYTIKYHLLYALLLNEIQKNHANIEQQEQTISNMHNEVEQVVSDAMSQIQALADRVNALENIKN